MAQGVLTGGCFHDRTSPVIPPPPTDPIPVPVDIQFTTNTTGEDIIKEVMGGFELFVFDEVTRLLVAIETVAHDQVRSGDIVLKLPAGRYTLVAWGGSGNEMENGGYHIAEPINEYTQEYGKVAIGKTTLESFRLRLTTNPSSSDENFVTPANSAFDELFYALAERVRIEPDVAPKVSFDFIRNSNLLRVKMAGINWLATTRSTSSPVNVYVTGRNGSFTYDNNISPYAEILRYDALQGTVDGNYLVMDIRLLRLDMVLHKKDPVWLWVEDARNDNIIARIDVMNTILKETDSYGHPLYRTQSDIDREEMFEIEIEFREPDPVTGNITIIINDWVFGEYAPGGLKPWKPKYQIKDKEQ